VAPTCHDREGTGDQHRPLAAEFGAAAADGDYELGDAATTAQRPKTNSTAPIPLTAATPRARAARALSVVLKSYSARAGGAGVFAGAEQRGHYVDERADDAQNDGYGGERVADGREACGPGDRDEAADQADAKQRGHPIFCFFQPSGYPDASGRGPVDRPRETPWPPPGTGVTEAVTGPLDVMAVLRRRDTLVGGLDRSGQVPWRRYGGSRRSAAGSGWPARSVALGG